MKSESGHNRYRPIWNLWKTFHEGKNEWTLLSFAFREKKQPAGQKPQKSFSPGLFVGLLPKVYAQEVIEAQGSKQDNHGLVAPPGDKMTISDRLVKEKPKVMISDQEVQEFLEKETGRDRLNAMFSKDMYGQLSPDLQFVIQGTTHCAGFSFLLFTILGGRVGRDEFIEKNRHTKFLTKFRAARAYNDAILLAGMKEGFRWALKLGFFSGIFLATSQSIAVYRNKSSLLEYVTAGVVTCSFLKMNMGLKGMFASGVFGTALGFLGGIVIYGGIYMFNETQEHRHYLMVHETLRKKRENLLLSKSEISTVPMVPSS